MQEGDGFHVEQNECKADMVSSVRPFDLMMGKIIGIGLVGLTAAAAEASPRALAPAYEQMQGHAVTQLSSHRKKYSEGERNTAAIVGAVVGAIIAKNT